MAAVAPRFLASADISPSRILIQDTTKNFHVTNPTDNTTKPIGISQDGTRDAPGITGASGLAASSGQPLNVYGDGEECLLLAGTGGWTAGDLIGSGSTTDAGKGVTLTPGVGLVWAVGRALETVSAGELGRVLIQIEAVNAAVS